MEDSELMYVRFKMEDLLPAGGTAQEVADSLAKNPAVVAAIQRGIDNHEPKADTDPHHCGGKGFKQSIVWELLGGQKDQPKG